MAELRSRKRLTLFFFFLMVIAVLVVALWQYHQMVVAVYDGASASVYRRMLRPFSSDFDSIGQHPIRIALLQAVPSDGEPAVGDGLVNQWEEMLTQQGFIVRRVATVQSRADLAGFNLVIVPGAVGLSDTELALIKDFVARGNGVIMSWAAGTRDKAGDWRDPWFLRHVAGIEVDMSVTDDETDGPMTVEFDAQSPFATGLEPGALLSVTRFDRPLTARVLESRTRVAGVRGENFASWREYDERLRPRPMRKRALIVHGDYLAGRFAWMGFTISSGSAAPEQQAAFQQVIRNAVVWTTRQPITVKPHWPETIGSAFTMAWRISSAEDVDDRLPALARAYRIPLTSYVTPDMLRESGESVRSLATIGPVALLLSEDLSVRAGAPPSLAVLRTWREQLAEVNRGAPNGCLIGFDTDSEWMDRLVEAGYDYVARPDSAHGLPRLLRTHRRVPVLVRAHELWEFPDTPIEAGPTDATALLRLFEASHETGALLHLSLSAAQIDDAVLQDLDDLFARIRRRRVWTAHAADVLDFYRVWGHLRVSSDYPTPHRYVVQVSNTGTRTASDFNVMIRLASPHRTLDISPTTLGTPAVHAVTEDGITWRFEIPRIPAGKNFIYHVYRSAAPGL